jgi:long-subunit acyl-CoA synthetase (AMP-forming)
MKISEPEIKKRIILIGPPASLARVQYSGWKRYDDLLGKGQLKKEEAFEAGASHETALLCYSSGTTSKSKGVEVSILSILQRSRDKQ